MHYNKLEDAQLDTLNTIFILDDFSIIPPETTMDKLKEILKDGEREYAKLKEAAFKMTRLIQPEVQELHYLLEDGQLNNYGCFGSLQS